MSADLKQHLIEEYLTTDELAVRIKMAPGTIRNLVWKGRLKKNIHYLKPTPRKLLFVWSQMEGWLYRDAPSKTSRQGTSSKSLINI